MTDYSEDSLVEQAAIALFSELGWQTLDCFYEVFIPEVEDLTSDRPYLGRETTSEFVLLSHLLPSLEKLNPDLPPEALTLAVEELTRDRSLMSPAHANREAERLVLDWRKHQQTRAAVQLDIANVLDKLPDVYSVNTYNQKCRLVYQHVYDSYYGAGRSTY